MSESPFKISIPDAALHRLRQKLELATLPDELKGAGWEYGVPAPRLPLAQRVRLAPPRGAAQRRAPAIHAPDPRRRARHARDPLRPPAAGAIPLLFVHGWPGTFLETRKIVPRAHAMREIGRPPEFPRRGSCSVCPSEGPKTKGFDMAQYAEVGHKLMLALGYTEYVTQGGD
ncbi:Alpha/Beta hydrolase protein [Mycena galericulata]|nr:Alpha/Beta hydrolase protein [Mycena galericulata]